MIRNDFEKIALKNTLLFSKEETVNYLKNYIKNISNKTELSKCNELLEKVKKEKIKTIQENLDNGPIHCYIYNNEKYQVEEIVADGFHFTYDNNSHELYVESFTFEEPLSIIIK